jgi:hypothetical protein
LVVVPADKKWFTRAVVAAATVDAMWSLDPYFPKMGAVVCGRSGASEVLFHLIVAAGADALVTGTSVFGDKEGGEQGCDD